jgi:hypothetical protein
MPITTTPSGGPQGEFSTNTPIYSTTLSATATSVTFSNIPSTFTDLVLVVNGSFSGTDYLNLQFNGDTTTSYSDLPFRGNGSAASAGAASSRAFIWTNTEASANSRFMCRSNIQNYANPNINKSVLSRGDSTTGYVAVNIGTWRKTEPITSIRVYGLSGNNFTVGSTFTIYGIKAAAPAPKATGGDVVVTDGTYWYHTFNTTGVFSVKQPLTADYLVVAGGGGGGQLLGGGGGAGGMRCTVTGTGGSGSLESALSLLAIDYAVTVGAGGAVGTTQNTNQAPNGSNSTFASITATGGGGGGAATGDQTQVGANGGSGGGGAGRTGIVGGSASPSGQGFGGGTANGQWGSTEIAGGGGGGASVAGGNASQPNGGSGGNGRATSISGSSVTYAGGGGGFGSGYPSGAGAGPGGTGGGGTGAKGYNSVTNATAGTANRGGGGGGGHAGYGLAAAGGSGIIIVRYPV